MKVKGVANALLMGRKMVGGACACTLTSRTPLTTDGYQMLADPVCYLQGVAPQGST